MKRCFWVIRIRNFLYGSRSGIRVCILPSTSQKIKINLDFYSFLTVAASRGVAAAVGRRHRRMGRRHRRVGRSWGWRPLLPPVHTPVTRVIPAISLTAGFRQVPILPQYRPTPPSREAIPPGATPAGGHGGPPGGAAPSRGGVPSPSQ
jgi:hypothetical protein